MPKIPLEKRLKKDAHKKVASAQDALVEAVYLHLPNTIIHGGTAIWRCYNGNRFSEDIDVYIPKKFAKEHTLNNFLNALKERGFLVRKFKKTENSIFSKFELLGMEVRLEVLFKDVKNFTVKPFELSDGTFMNVYTLSPEDLLVEKIRTYMSRKKARDLYDVWFLRNLVEDPGKIRSCLKDIPDKIEEPQDSDTLKSLIIFGAVPSLRDLMEGVKSWAKKNI